MPPPPYNLFIFLPFSCDNIVELSTTVASGLFPTVCTKSLNFSINPFFVSKIIIGVGRGEISMQLFPRLQFYEHLGISPLPPPPALLQTQSAA